MKKVGLLTGISYVTGVDYYKSMNEHINRLLPLGKVMKKNSHLVMVSLDCDEYVHRINLADSNKDYSGVYEYLCDGIEDLYHCKVDFLVICSNTAHMSVPRAQERFPDLPILHIADCTAKKIKTCGMTKVGLVGTKATMCENYLKDQLSKHGILTIVPNMSQIEMIWNIIVNELSYDIFNESSRQILIDIIHSLISNGAQGIIMGCTELELLVSQQDISNSVVLFPSAAIHIEAAAKIQSGFAQLTDYLPD